MKKNLGILIILLLLFITTAIGNPRFLQAYNLSNLLERTSLVGIIGIGAAFVIVTSGIDLSIGSLIVLVASIVPLMVSSLSPLMFLEHNWVLPVALMTVLLLSAVIGSIHGLLITKMKLQPFVVTLSGLMIYRGVARVLTADGTQGYGDEVLQPLRYLALGKIPLGRIPVIGNFALPVPFVIFVTLSIVAAVFLNRTIYGRYLLAIGRNEQAARYSGINTGRMILMAYIICSVITCLGGLLYAVNVGSVQADIFANSYELYAIAVAVLGGCSLRGGEASIFGIALGAMLLRLVLNSVSMLGFNDTWEPIVVGAVILIGAITDEMVKRMGVRRRAIQQAREAAAK